MAGGWEFPGGKLNPGESREQALARELQEELGVVVREAHPLIRIRHAYPEFDVDLDLWMLTRYDGEPSAREGQAISWFRLKDLQDVDLLPADRPMVTALQLPICIDSLSTEEFVVRELPDLASEDTWRTDRRWHGVVCRGASAGALAPELVRAAAVADFIVLSAELSEEIIREACACANVPIYVRGDSLENAWACGASGLCDLPMGARTAQ
jgi:mutator protein MutT